MKHFKHTIVLLTVAVLCGCNNFGDMNDNPNKVTSSPASTFVQPIVYYGSTALVNRHHRLITELMQYTVQVNGLDAMFNYVIKEADCLYMWEQLYRRANDANIMVGEAIKEADPAAEGVARILKAWLMSNLTDIYGDIPYFDGLKGKDYGLFKPAYDAQDKIYNDIFAELEHANALLGEKSTRDLDAVDDFLYGGKAAQWRKFGNSLYLRLSMRAALKSPAAAGKVKQIHDNPQTYPVFGSGAEAAVLRYTNAAPFMNPFYSWTTQSWSSIKRMCSRLMTSLDDNSDPRMLKYATGSKGMDTHITPAEIIQQSAGAARFPETLKQDGQFAIMNYSEVLFIYAEAVQRGIIDGDDAKAAGYYEQAVRESVMEWNPSVSDDALDVFLAKPGVSYDNTLDRLFTQKWISLYFVGFESWYDYRRTGYPLMPTGTTVQNDGVLPTRLRYPAEEFTLNGEQCTKAVNGWLGGSNDMVQHVWWADHTDKRP